MAIVMAHDAAPLMGISALVLDTEATGLDPAKARIVEIGAVAIDGGLIRPGPALEMLVDCGSRIPASATRVHGISDADVSGAPSFGEVASHVSEAMRDRVLVGHNIGFDLALLRREYELAGLTWQMPRALDVRVLAEVARPRLASYSLEALMDWLGVEIRVRHRAVGDAEATAHVFLGLLPHLRAAGIRTLAEAEAAHRRLDRTGPDGHPAGWLMPAEEMPIAKPSGLADSYPYRNRVAAVMSAPVVTLSGELETRSALDVLIERKISSVVVERADGHRGLVTERDLLRALQRQLNTGRHERLADYMSHPLATIEAEDFIYRAIGRMDRLGLRHLPVTDESGAIIGMVTPRNLLRQRAGAALALRDALDQASGVEDLARGWSGLPEVARSLLDEGVDARQVAAVISAELTAVTARSAELAEARLQAEGVGPPPVGYAVLVLGSGGRGESLLAADQDNAIVYAAGEPDGPESRYFAALGEHLSDTLDAIGVAYCKGGVMAKTPAWRQSRAGWQETIQGWVRRSSPQDLLNVDIFFDGVVVHGERQLARDVFAQAVAVARRERQFLLLLAELAREWQPPKGFFGGLRVDEDGRIDLKKHGIMPIFTAARVLALRNGIDARSTRDRLERVRDAGIGSAEDLDRANRAHEVLLREILRQQLEDIRSGIALGNRVDIGKLDKSRLKELKDALAAIPGLLGVLSEGRL